MPLSDDVLEHLGLLSSHSAAIAGNTATLVTIHKQITEIAGRLERLESRFDGFESFLKSKLNGGEQH